MKSIFILLLFCSFSVFSQNSSIYDIEIEYINGEKSTMKDFEGKKILIVNVASKCGLTPQYKDLQKLYDEYSENGFVVVGFPANNFLNQEPGTNEEIKAFCEYNYGVTFPMMSKISVVGDDMHKLYQWLTDEELNGVMSSEVKWNFQKYLIDEEGNFVHVIYSKTPPLDEIIINWINAD